MFRKETNPSKRSDQSRREAKSSKELSVVERARQQRELRAQQSVHAKNVIRIQSLYRRYRSNTHLRNEQLQLLAKRLQDINTLRTILSKTKGIAYVPPPATTTALAQQLLFCATSRTISPQVLHTFDQFVEYCLIPGLSQSNDNLNPLSTWLATSHGRHRLERCLRLSVLAFFDESLPLTARVLELFQLLLLDGYGGSSFAAKEPTCRSMLLLPRRPREPSPTDPYSPISASSGSLDLIAALRYTLMFRMTKASRPIPEQAQELREACFHERAKERAGGLFIVLQNAIENTLDQGAKQLLGARMVCEIFSIPLLTWKITASAIASLTQPSPNVFVVKALEGMAETHGDILAAGNINKLFAPTQISLAVCPATSAQCLLANLVQLCHMIPMVNGSDPERLDSRAAALYFNILAVLVDAIPLGTFSSRDSSIEWVTDGRGQHTPIVLSPVVIDQCKLLLLDSFVRKLYTCAIDLEALNTVRVLNEKNENDLKQEKDLFEGGASSPAALAEKEARVDRTRTFWQSSKWAQKLTKGVTSLWAGENDRESTQTKELGEGSLMNTSTMSKKLAGGLHETVGSTLVIAKTVDNQNHSVSTAKRATYYPDLLVALCRTYGIVLARWGGGGQDDFVRRTREKKTEDKDVASPQTEACALSLLNVLCFSTSIIKATWGIIQSDPIVASDVHSIIDSAQGRKPVRMLCVLPSFAKQSKRGTLVGDGNPLLYMFVVAMSHVLIVTDDIEILDLDRPLPAFQIRRCIQLLKKLLYRACWIDDSSTFTTPTYFGLSLISASSKTMRDLYDRSSRRPLCIPKVWIVADLLEKEIRHAKTHSDYTAMLSLPVLRVCPFLVSFKRRLTIFERIVTTNRIALQGVNDSNPFNSNPLKPGIPIQISRSRLLEDGLATMNGLGSDMRRRIAVQYVNEAGTREAGIDAGGLFKEFWTDLSGIAFDPNYALFRVTDGAGHCLYPNPLSGAAHGPDHIRLFSFLGRILGKALYEGITIHPRFAHFFLSFLKGDYNFLHMLPDLSTVDPQLYNNLMFLKTFDGDAADLCLTFTVTHNEFGGTRDVNLIKNGAEVEVTNCNKQRYIGLVAKHYVVDQVKEQSEAFTRGLWEVIDRSWLQIFNEPELQVLISGASDGKIDVDDMRSNTRYLGGYSGLDRTVNRFWAVVKSLDSREQSELLRFVTSCERPPPLGFASMNPPFTLQRVGILRDSDKLPSASTCFNTLKLPTYSSEKVLKERLLYAIKSGAGFELS
jgi:ubiquitin-protein ligase E3 C